MMPTRTRPNSLESAGHREWTAHCLRSASRDAASMYRMP